MNQVELMCMAIGSITVPPLISLMLVATTEAFFHFWRYRVSHKGGPVTEGLSALSVGMLRIAFVLIGISAADSGLPLWLLVLCYGIPIGVTTGLLRWACERNTQHPAEREE